MKELTKDWLKKIELYELWCMLNPQSGSKIPIVFCGAAPEQIPKSQLISLEDGQTLTVLFVPDTFSFLKRYSKTAVEPDMKSIEDDFVSQYINRLRIISNLPEELIDKVRDRRLLALGYADKKVKKKVSEYSQTESKKAYELWEKSIKKSSLAEDGLTIKKQFENHSHINCIVDLLDETNITAVSTLGESIYIQTDNGETVILSGAQILEEETSPAGAYIKTFELIKAQKHYELHLLLMKRGKRLTENYYCVTYIFTDMKLM